MKKLDRVKLIIHILSLIIEEFGPSVVFIGAIISVFKDNAFYSIFYILVAIFLEITAENVRTRRIMQDYNITKK